MNNSSEKNLKLVIDEINNMDIKHLEQAKEDLKNIVLYIKILLVLVLAIIQN